MRVAGVAFGAQFSQLLGADAAAAAPSSTRLMPALSLPNAVLASGWLAAQGEEEHEGEEDRSHSGSHGQGAVAGVGGGVQ